MSVDAFNLTPKLREISLSEGDQTKDWIKSLKGELDYDGVRFRYASPKNTHFSLSSLSFQITFQTRYKRHIAREEFDHYQPEFEYGVAYTKAELVCLRASKVQQWINQNPYVPSGRPFFVKKTSGYKQQNLLPRLYSDYNLKSQAADPDTLVEQSEEEFGRRATWDLSSPNDKVLGVRPRYEISGE
ncbi:hypothetical protein AAF712_010655 [Marasmius tenuissimus]|uniref:Uncharacterized protein n=1 Tax=Marasmius tenuissimus TaxID=585030 RepID=A0ABR2ZM68_9AGAR